ncbi:hypothetical protein [Geoalkalibacter sp.]|uniref:hypothetical protein n=1 Tax=Geoalkalibacter sp. TaxID=3041440 RepID=UPI00272EE7D2|nr:hypothetical protein [Geoalkalibacter sp.]
MYKRTSVVESRRALFLNRLTGALPQGYERLYFGSEFCCWSFPEAERIEAALGAARAAGMAFTLATPVVAEDFLPGLRKTLDLIAPALQDGDEILLSDWGALTLARAACPQVPLVLGRVLSGQKRGPQILDLGLRGAALDYFRRGSWYGAHARELLAELGIARVELDNLLQGVAALPAGLQGSLHHPYAFVTSTRGCPWRPPGSRGPCGQPCGEVFSLISSREPGTLLQCGNTQFLENPRLPENLAELGIDRLVFHPHLPR